MAGNFIGYFIKKGKKFLFSTRENATHFYANGKRTQIKITRKSSEEIQETKRHASNVKYQANRLGFSQGVKTLHINEIEPVIPEISSSVGVIDADKVFEGMSLKDFLEQSKKLDKEMENQNSRKTISGLKLKDEEYFKKRANVSNDELSRIVKLFDEANKIITEVKLGSDNKLGNYFALFKTTSKDALDRRIKAALDVLGLDKLEDIDNYEMEEQVKNYRVMEYINTEGRQYQNDFVDAFLNYLDKEDAKKLKKAVYSLTPEAFMKLLKGLNQDSLAYSLDSTIEDFGWELVLGSLNMIMNQIKELHEKNNTNVKIDQIEDFV